MTTPPSDGDDNDKQLAADPLSDLSDLPTAPFNFTEISKKLNTFKELAVPYFTESESGRNALVTVIGFTLLN